MNTLRADRFIPGGACGVGEKCRDKATPVPFRGGDYRESTDLGVQAVLPVRGLRALRRTADAASQAWQACYPQGPKQLEPAIIGQSWVDNRQIYELRREPGPPPVRGGVSIAAYRLERGKAKAPRPDAGSLSTSRLYPG